MTITLNRFNNMQNKLTIFTKQMTVSYLQNKWQTYYLMTIKVQNVTLEQFELTIEQWQNKIICITMLRVEVIKIELEWMQIGKLWEAPKNWTTWRGATHISLGWDPLHVWSLSQPTEWRNRIETFSSSWSRAEKGLYWRTEAAAVQVGPLVGREQKNLLVAETGWSPQ